jgi:hypothetical protein
VVVGVFVGVAVVGVAAGVRAVPDADDGLAASTKDGPHPVRTTAATAIAPALHPACTGPLSARAPGASSSAVGVACPR